MQNEPDTLANVEAEDIFDVILRMEKSFDIKFEDGDFEQTKNFGELCDVIESKILAKKHVDDCTLQQAFYKIRDSVMNTQSLNKKSITPATKLNYIFPRKVRAKLVSSFNQQIGVDIDFLAMNGFIATPLIILLLASIIGLFISWKIAVLGLLLSISGLWLAGRFSKELVGVTVGDLTRKMVREHYMNARRLSGTINQEEVRKLIPETFAHDLGFEIKDLTIESPVF